MAQDSQLSRRNLSIIIFVVTLFIVVLYNLPGSRKPGTVEPGPIVMPDPVLAEDVKEGEPVLTSLGLIEQSEPKAHRIHIESWKTPNGAKVLFVKANEIPMLDVRVVFDAGGARDDKLPGLANLTSAMLTEGAGIADVDTIARHFEGLGASLNTSSYRDMAVASLRTLSDPQFREPALSLFYDVVAQPTFPESSLERLKAQMMLSLQREKQSPGAIAQKTFFDELYGAANHPYGIHTKGTEDSLGLISTLDLQQFHQKYYVASNMVVAMIGDIERSDAELIALQLDKQLPQGTPAPKLPKPAALESAKQAHVEFPSSQTHILVGGVGIARGNPDHYALAVGNEILGAGGFSSRLNKIIRQENGLAYSVYSHFTPMSVAGPFSINLQTRNDQSQQAITLLNSTLSDFIQNGPTKQELSDAKRHLLGSFPLQTASNGNIVSYLGMIGFYDLPKDYLEQYPAKIEDVSIKDIKKAFQKAVNSSALLTVTVGGSSDNPAQPAPQ